MCLKRVFLVGSYKKRGARSFGGRKKELIQTVNRKLESNIVFAGLKRDYITEVEIYYNINLTKS